MSKEDYGKAYKLGKKDYQTRLMRGELPTLKVLDYILPEGETFTEVPLGLVQIPVSQIVGTKTDARSNAFAGNFMPILDEDSEFAQKWASLSTSHVEEGIREPIKAYEYMNQFYVEEGNKRVSVLKFFDVVSIPGTVTRILPKRTEDKENKIYYEFLDFYQVSQINYIWFSKEGSFAKLQEAVGKDCREEWTAPEQRMFSSVYARFTAEYESQGGKKLHILPGDAFLAMLELYDYRELCDMTTSRLKSLVKKSWQEFELLEKEENIDLKMAPAQAKKPLLGSLFAKSTSRLKVGFLYEKTPTSSAWTYAHELGRLHLEQTFPQEVETLYYDQVTADSALENIEKAIAAGCDIVFTTTPAFVQGSVKAAIAHPEVRILNCSLNTSHRYIRTYYSRMHEAKFLMGAIAGAMTDNNRIFYLGDYPIYGSIANINAFALGAKMINPRARIYLDWSSKKDVDIEESIRKVEPDCVSGKDMVIPEEASRFFGFYYRENDQPHNLAMPLWHWGKFYEQLIRTIMNGTWGADDKTSDNKAINYWWGISSGVVDVICSKSLPSGTGKLVDLLREMIISGNFNPFAGVIHSQTGLIQGDPDAILSPEAIIKMDWLAENVIGSIPEQEEITEDAKATLSQQGVHRKGPGT